MEEVFSCEVKINKEVGLGLRNFSAYYPLDFSETKYQYIYKQLVCIHPEEPHKGMLYSEENIDIIFIYEGNFKPLRNLCYIFGLIDGELVFDFFFGEMHDLKVCKDEEKVKKIEVILNRMGLPTSEDASTIEDM